MTPNIMQVQVLKTDEILKTDQCDICMEDFTINGLKFCGNSVKDGKTECKYKMCEKCLIELKRKLRSKCPQCRNKILVKIFSSTCGQEILVILKLYNLGSIKWEVCLHENCSFIRK